MRISAIGISKALVRFLAAAAGIALCMTLADAAKAAVYKDFDRGDVDDSGAITKILGAQIVSGDTIDLSHIALNDPLGEKAITFKLPGGSFTVQSFEKTQIQNAAIVCTKINSTIELRNVNIRSANGQAQATLAFVGKGNSLELSGENALANGQSKRRINCGAAVGAGENTYLTISGKGSLEVTGGKSGAGIGGGYLESVGSIIIKSGMIKASASNTAAGIGIGEGGDFGSITIGGGAIEAYGNGLFAGINASVFVNGGKICAVGGVGAPGIGGSYGSVSISDGIINAIGGEGGAGIGGIQFSNCPTVKISGGDIIAQGGKFAAGIGSSKGSNSDAIEITGGKIKARGGIGGAGLGAGLNGSAGKITVGGEARIEARGGPGAYSFTSIPGEGPEASAIGAGAGIGGGGGSGEYGDKAAGDGAMLLIKENAKVLAVGGASAHENCGAGAGAGGGGGGWAFASDQYILRTNEEKWVPMDYFGGAGEGLSCVVQDKAVLSAFAGENEFKAKGASDIGAGGAGEGGARALSGRVSELPPAKILLKTLDPFTPYPAVSIKTFDGIAAENLLPGEYRGYGDDDGGQSANSGARGDLEIDD